MNSLTFSLLMLIMFISNNGNAQTNFWDSKDAYLRQTPPGDTPKVFAPGMLADSGIVLGRVAFSNDGKEFYYGFARHWFDFSGTGVKQITFDGKEWSKPKVIVKDLATPTLSIDGSKLFFGGQRSDVWESEKINNGWSTPTLFSR